MSWKGHLAVGFIFMLLATFVVYMLSVYADLIMLELTFVVIGWIVGLYCSLLPDIDIKTSKVFSFTITICLILIIYFVVAGLLIELVALVIFIILIMSLSHRGITHKWYISIFIGLLCVFIFTSAIVGIYAFLGYLSHAGIEKSH